MKLSKLDPMTGLMLVVAFGVVVTMLTQNSVASVDKTPVNASVQEQPVSADLPVTKMRVSSRDIKQEAMHVSFDAPATVKNRVEKKDI